MHKNIKIVIKNLGVKPDAFSRINVFLPLKNEALKSESVNMYIMGNMFYTTMSNYIL